MLTSTAELEKIIDDPSLILIDARSFQESVSYTHLRAHET